MLAPMSNRCIGGFSPSHRLAGVEDAWRIVEWYKQRWIIEQFFRVLKTQGFKLEDSQIGTADRLLKLVAIAAKAAVITIQLVQARNGRASNLIHMVFTANERRRPGRPQSTASGQDQTTEEPASA